MLGRAPVRVGLVVLAAALAFVGWATAGAYDANGSDEAQGAAAIVGAAATALFVGLSAIREPADKLLLLAALAAAGGLIGCFAFE